MNFCSDPTCFFTRCQPLRVQVFFRPHQNSRFYFINSWLIWENQRKPVKTFEGMLLLIWKRKEGFNNITLGLRISLQRIQILFTVHIVNTLLRMFIYLKVSSALLILPNKTSVSQQQSSESILNDKCSIILLTSQNWVVIHFLITFFYFCLHPGYFHILLLMTDTN